MRLQPYTKNYKHPGKAGSTGGVPHCEGHLKVLSAVKWSALQTYVQVTVYVLIRLYFENNMYIY